jgi:hypothetical protein
MYLEYSCVWHNYKLVFITYTDGYLGATFNNISLISALLVEKPGVPGQTHPGADPGGAPGAPPKIGKN